MFLGPFLINLCGVSGCIATGDWRCHDGLNFASNDVCGKWHSHEYQDNRFHYTMLQITKWWRLITSPGRGVNVVADLCILGESLIKKKAITHQSYCWLHPLHRGHNQNSRSVPLFSLRSGNLEDSFHCIQTGNSVRKDSDIQKDTDFSWYSQACPLCYAIIVSTDSLRSRWNG